MRLPLKYAGALLLAGILLVNARQWHNPEPWEFPEMRHFPRMPISLENPVTKEGVALGRYLFYDPILSSDSTFSCATCHRQSRAFSDGGQKLSVGISGEFTERNTPPLFNLAWYPAMFWDGRAATIEEQVFHPVRDRDEMNLNWQEAESRIQRSKFYAPLFRAAFGEIQPDSQHIAKALGQFMRTIISANTRFDKVLRHEQYLTRKEYRGFVLMSEQHIGNCLHCHPSDSNPLTTNREYANNGLEPAQTPGEYPDPGLGAITGNPADFGKFKVPSLRNIALTAPYMHDGRFQTLEEVLDFYAEQVQAGVNTDHRMAFLHRGGTHMTCEQRDSILSFLYCLTDSTLISDPAFSDPFVEH